MKWYKRDPDAALAGMIGLTPEERGIYNTVIDLLYSRDGDLPTDDKFFARACECRPQVWRRVRDALLAKGKLHLKTDGKLTANRVENELQTASKLMAKMVHMGRVSAKKRKAINKANPTACELQPQPHPDKDLSSLRSDRSLLDPSSLHSEGSSKRTKRSRARIPFPPDWKPADWSDFEFERFRDHAIANGRLCAGQVGWEAAWRNWKTSPYRRTQNGTGHRSVGERARDLADEWRRREAEISGTPHHAGGHRTGRQTD